MKNHLIALALLCCAFALPASAQELTHFQRINRFERGAYLGFGAMTAQMLNRNYIEAVKDGVIKPKAGFVLDFQYAFAPVSLTATVFSSIFKVKQLGDYIAENEVLIRHTGAEFGLTFTYLHVTKYFLPFIGAAASFSDLGAPISWGGAQEKDSEIPLYVKAIRAPVLKLGCNLNFGPGLGLRFEYRRTLQSELQQIRQGFNQFSATLNFHVPKD